MLKKKKIEIDCAVPENIQPHSPHGRDWNFLGERSVRPKKLKTCMKLNWNFQRGGAVGVQSKTKSVLCGRYVYILDLPLLIHQFRYIKIQPETMDLSTGF